MIVTTPTRGRVAAALIAVITALAISIGPSSAAQAAPTANAPTAACGGSGSCA